MVMFLDSNPGTQRSVLLWPKTRPRLISRFKLYYWPRDGACTNVSHTPKNIQRNRRNSANLRLRGQCENDLHLSCYV